MSIKINHELPVPEVLKMSTRSATNRNQSNNSVMKKSAVFSQVNPINSSFWSDHVLQITKIPYVNM